MFVNGSWLDGAADPIPHIHPATGEMVFQAPHADRSAVNAAVTAARSAFDDGVWPRMMGKDRARYLRKIADLIRTDAANLNTLLSLDKRRRVRSLASTKWEPSIRQTCSTLTRDGWTRSPAKRTHNGNPLNRSLSQRTNPSESLGSSHRGMPR
ncbi:MAG: aldehyde dehydrogenase family protein [Actinomycetota bacterium]|nr:aldehyde dehydrogenase family protein [Actinomycetota bacterium]